MLTEVWPFVDDKRRTGRHVVLARLIDRDGPGSRPVGATMAVASDGTWRGSVSGGCVEGIVLDEARAVLDGAPPHLTSVSPGHHLMPWEQAPSCAGALSVLIAPAPPEPIHTAITTALTANRSLALRIDLHPPFTWSTAAAIDAVADPSAAFVEELRSRPRLILVGATDLAATLATLAAPLHRDVIVIDPRPDHAQPDQFPPTTTVIRAWPDQWLSRHPLDRRDAVLVLTHDPRIDDRAIRAALATQAHHVAVLGSRTTHAQRLVRLADVPGIDRLVGPAGLDLGGGSLAESALSMLAEIIAAENHRTGRRLHLLDSRIRASHTR